MSRLYPMSRWLLACLWATAWLAPGLGQGAVIERDWKTQGDGLLTYDDVNQREWLDLTETQLEQFPGANREARYQYIVGQTVPSGLFEGFVVAKSMDVVSFSQSAGIDTTTDDFEINQTPTTTLIDLLGRTSRPDLTYASGLIDEVEGPPTLRVGAEFVVRPRSGLFGQAGVLINSYSDGLQGYSAGVMLYRAIPEPSSFWLMILFVLGLAAKHRNRKTGGTGLVPCYKVLRPSLAP